MENRTINIATVAEIAKALEELKDQMVFVGGAVISLYTDDPAADEIRPTGDIDLTIRLMNFSDWTIMQTRLAELKFFPNPNGHAICSYLYKNIAVDIMPSEDGPIGPANKWYKIGFDDLHTVNVEGETIQILSASCFLATKFEAFNQRGTDYRTSHDFEDIIYVLDNRLSIVEEVLKAKDSIKSFIKSELKKIIDNPSQEEIISAHIHPFMLDERIPILIEKMKAIIKGGNAG